MVDILLLRYVNAFKNSYIILMGCKSCFEILVIKLWTQYILVHISSVQSLIRVWLFGAPWTAVRQASLYITNSQSLLKLMSIESMMPSNHLILCHPLLLLPSIFPSIRVFSNKPVLHRRWPKYWSFSFSISSSNEYSGLISFNGLVWPPCSPRDSQESSPMPQFKSINFLVLAFFIVQLSHPYMTTGKTIHLTRWTFVGCNVSAF